MMKPPLESFIVSPIQKEDLDIPAEKIIEKLRGKKGDQGEKGEKGDDGTPTMDELEAIILPLIPVAKDGKDGLDGRQGERGFPGEDGRPGKDGKTGQDGLNGKDGSSDTPKEIIEKINKSRGEKIKNSKIEGFDDIESYAKSANDKIQKYLLMGGSTLVKLQANGVPLGDFSTLNFVNGTVTNTNGTANYTSSGGGGGTGSIFLETPSGLINGSNTTYTVLNSITTPLNFSINGEELQPDTATQTNDYSYSGTTITLHTALPASLASLPFVFTYTSGTISSGSELTATGTINSVNTAFTFIQKPTYIVMDGAYYKEGGGWTWDSGTLTATMSKAPDNTMWGIA